MLEITADDIARLDDEQLRAVVARLCEAEVRSRGLSASHVTWGGNQNAADDGIDVRVSLPQHTVLDGFIPRPAVGFQVKAQNMTKAQILEEMCPDGTVRPSIQSLADESGGYIIVSSEGSTSNRALANRRGAMRSAVIGIQHGTALFLDFYDRTRIATWLRSHEGLIPWVRTLVGRPISGWQSYGAWAYDPMGKVSEYFIDETLRLHPSKRETEYGLTVVQGINQLKSMVKEPRNVVRLVGLSGVGKTRLVQALFDEQVSKDNLDPSLAIYTNMADEPDPQPAAMASSLIARGTPAILVIDNCPSDLHNRLSEICRQHRSKISLLTVEYDIQDDTPEGTEVFTLKPSSAELIERLIRRRYPDISPVDRQTISEFSGGNARVALALAASAERDGTIAGLSDKELLQRLFWQRDSSRDESLYLIAQACALVYSFRIDGCTEGGPSELMRLGLLVGKTEQEMYRGVAELKRRDLVQQRSVWRAVLPHAIANRLAATALQNIPYAKIREQLLTESAERLMRSFSRRLGYLHNSEEATQIISEWLAVNGLLANVATLNDLKRAMFENVAPSAPQEALAALERAVTSPGAAAVEKCTVYIDLLRSLSFEAVHFDRAVWLLVKLLLTMEVSKRGHGVEVFQSLFQLILSGTHASIEQRVAVVRSLLRSSNENIRDLGVKSLGSLLEALNYRGAGTFDFGAQSRDYGYWPRSDEEVRHWYRLALLLAKEFGVGDGPAALHVRATLANSLRGLWLRSGCEDEIVSVCEAICKSRFWPEGWRAVRRALESDGKGLEKASLTKMVDLEKLLRPTDLIEKVRAIVFYQSVPGIYLDEFEDDTSDDITVRMRKTEVLARDLGTAVVSDPLIFTELLPEIVSSRGRLWSFGLGLAEAEVDGQIVWQQLVSAMAGTAEAAREPEALRGFLNKFSSTQPELAALLLDEAVEHNILSAIYPILQMSVSLDANDVARLKRSIVLGKAPAATYRYLMSSIDDICAPDLRDLVMGVAKLPVGEEVALDLVNTYLSFVKNGNREPAPELIDTGRQLLQAVTLSKTDTHRDYCLGQIATSCLRGESGAEVALSLCQRLRQAAATYAISAYNHDDLIWGIFTAQPIAALNGLCGRNAEDLKAGIRILRDTSTRGTPLDVVPENDLLQWCEEDQPARYPAIAQTIAFVASKTENKETRWSNIALRILEAAPDPQTVLSIFVSRFKPSSGWTGELTNVLESNAVLLDQLDNYPLLRDTVESEKERLRKWIADERQRELLWNKQRDERFE